MHFFIVELLLFINEELGVIGVPLSIGGRSITISPGEPVRLISDPFTDSASLQLVIGTQLLTSTT